MDGAAIINGRATHEHRLDNGLTLLVREDHSAPVVAIVTHVKAGYFDEPDRLVGVSHVLEHMFFKGTPRRGVGEIARQTKGAGGYLNAGTIYDYTSYYTVLPSSALELGLDVQADALRNSLVDESELERELLVIIQEVKRKLDNPGALAVESLYATLFDAHPIRRWRMGTEEQLRAYTRDDVVSYYRRMYRPSNIIMVIAGAVDPAETVALVERYYGDMEDADIERPDRPVEPTGRGFRFREMAGDITHSYMELGWATPGVLHPDTPVIDLLALVLGQGRASRLYRGVREAGWVSGISAYNYTPTELGVFGIGAELDPADTRSALTATWREVDRMRAEGVTDAEVARAKNVLEARHLRRVETVEGQANLLAEWEAAGGWRRAAEYLDRLFTAGAADVSRVCRDYLDLDRGALLIYRPESADPLELDAAGAARMLRSGNGEAPPVVASTPPTRRAPAGAPDFQAAGVEDGVHFYTMANGARIAVQPIPSPMVSMTIACPGGRSEERADAAGITGLMSRTSIKGTRNRDAARIADESEWLGGAISPSVSADMLQWTLTVPARHFQPAFDLLADVALAPDFPRDKLDRERKVALANLERIRDDMYRYPFRLFLQSAFPDHPYGFSLATIEAAVPTLERAAIADWHRRKVLGVRPWVLVAGSVEPHEVARAAAHAFRDLPSVSEDPAAPPARWPEAARCEAVQRERAQTAIVLGVPGPGRTDDDRYAFQLLANAISGLGNRLFEELRSRRSLAYTVSVQPMLRARVGAFVGYIATSPEREEEARSGLLEQFELVAREGVSDDEIERARRYTIGTWQIRRQTAGARLMDLTSALLLGEGLAEIRDFEDRIRKVTTDEIRAAMGRFFDPDRVVEGIVRGQTVPPES